MKRKSGSKNGARNGHGGQEEDQEQHVCSFVCISICRHNLWRSSVCVSSLYCGIFVDMSVLA